MRCHQCRRRTAPSGNLRIAPFFSALTKVSRLDQAQAHPEADDHHHGREEERHAPAPREEVGGPLAGALGVGEQEVDREEHRVGDDEAERCAELREGAVPGALAGGGVLGRDERRAGPLAAEREALREAEDQQEERRPPADVVVGREAADQERRDAHREQRRDEGRLAAEAVAEVPEDDGAEGAGDHRGAEHGERGQQGGRVVAGREEEDREDEDGGRRVDVEVVELDGGADQARRDDAGAGIGGDGRGRGSGGG